MLVLLQKLDTNINLTQNPKTKPRTVLYICITKFIFVIRSTISHLYTFGHEFLIETKKQYKAWAKKYTCPISTRPFEHSKIVTTVSLHDEASKIKKTHFLHVGVDYSYPLKVLVVILTKNHEQN